MFFRQMEYLVALARERHFGRAAAACWVSQPTLSDGIRKLESEFGVTIVHRAHRFEGFTPEGELLLGWARRLLADRQDLVSELASVREGLSGRLRLGAIPTAMPALSSLSTAFCDRHPEVRVSILSMTSNGIRRGLQEFELDAGITYLTEQSTSKMRSTPLYGEKYLLLTGEDVFPDRHEVSWREASQLPLCLLTPDMQHRQIIESVFARVGVVPDVRMETNSISTLCAHVQHSRWSSVLPQTWFRLVGRPAGTKVLRLVEPQEQSSIGVIAVERAPLPLLTSAFLEVADGLDVQANVDGLIPNRGDHPASDGAAGPAGNEASD